MSKSVGKSLKRVVAYDKATGRAKYTDDLCGREALIVKICHSTIAHGFVKRIDTAAAGADSRGGASADLLRRARVPLSHGGSSLVYGPRPSGRGGPAALKPPCPLLWG